MVPKKGKSKRLPAATKYKIKKKVAESHRKARKEAKKNPDQRKPLKKDPGIPNLFPFKEKLLQQAEESKRQAIEEKKQAKLLRNSEKAGLTEDQADLAAFAKSAARRSLAFETGITPSNGIGTIIGDSGSFAGVSHGDAAAMGRKDNSRKAYYREFKKVVDNADVILEVLDARDPLGCRTKQIEELIMNAGADKRIILVLNKIDLVPKDVVEQWLKYLRNEFPTIAFKASTQNQRSNLSQSNVSAALASDALLNGSECVGADNLVKLLKNYCRNLNIKTSITVGVVGFPNVGKSSVINSLKRSKACNVGATPGVTKVAQTIHLDKNIKLLDCPGIVFSHSNNAEDAAQVLLRNCVKVELLQDPIGPVDVIIKRCKKEQLIKLYEVKPFVDTSDFLVQLARIRGKLRRGGIPDLESTARSVVQDWNSGRIPFYTVPPASGVAVESHISSEIVQTWSKEFSLPDILETEHQDVQANAKSTHLRDMVPIKDLGSVPVDMDMHGLPEGYADADTAAQDEEEMEDDEEDDAEDDDEDDDDEEEQDGGDAMDEDEDQNMNALAAMAAKKRSMPVAPEIRFKPVQKKAAAVAAALAAKRGERSTGLSAAEASINPQTNQQMRKNQKQRKKEMRRAARSADGDEDME
eukprot:jgi/Hompol1/2267/HPOL_002872-RA